MTPEDAAAPRSGKPEGAAQQLSHDVTNVSSNGSSVRRVEQVYAASTDGPCPGHTQWRIRVRCHQCGGTHLHRAVVIDPDGLARTAPCDGRRYVVIPILGGAE